MSVEHFALGLLTVVLLAQQIIWAKICFGLTNRLMSRNFYEFEQAHALSKPSVEKHPPVEPDYDAERQALGANSLMGVI